MANGVQLATAYISLNVRTDGIKKQVESALKGTGSQGRQAGTAIGSNIIAGIREHMSGGRIGAIFAPIAVTGVRWAANAGRAIGTALRTAIVSSISLGVGAALLGATAALTAGLDRLKTIQRAQVQLSLTLPPSEIKRVTKDIQDVVRGTPIALDEALQAVPRALSAGIKPGKELNQYIKNIADTAASTGGQAGFGQIDIIFSQILGKGKLMGEELMQLTENGVDLRNALKNTFNWDDKKLNSLVAKGKVGMKEIQQAVEQTWGKNGGLSKQMGNTFDGAMGNLKASVARLGANVLGLIFGDPNNPDDPLKGAIDGITSFTQKIDTMGKWVAEHREDIRGYFDGARDTAGKLGAKIKDVVEWLKSAWSTTQDVGSKIADGFNRGRDAVGNLWTAASDKLGKIKSKISEIFDDLKKKFDGIFGENGWIAQQFDKLGRAVDKVREVLGLGPATASAAAPGGAAGGTVPFNPGPMAPGVASGQLPLGGSTQGLSSVPTFGMDANGNPLTSTSGAMAQANAQDAAKPRKVGSDGGLLPGTIALKDYLATKFPEITDIGGYRDTDYTPFGVVNEHSSGKAIDVMVPKQFMDPETGKPTPEGIAWGDKVLREALAKGASVLWKQTQFDPDGSTTSMGDRGDNTQNHWDHLHVLEGSYANYATGGGIAGPGNGTSDSIPAMLSNGEHVLTAADVKAMGGQSGVYAFRQALQAGLIPGFAPGGAVDPNVVTDAQNNIADLNNSYLVATAQLNELINNGDASPSDLLRAQQNLKKSKLALDQAQADLPIIAGGGTPPDRSKQNRVNDVTDQLALLQQQMAEQQDSGADIPYSQQLQQNYQLESLKRDRNQAIADIQGTGAGTDYGAEFVRSLGFIPAAAGSSTVAGTSSLAGFINMGNSVVSGVIDTGVNLANQAVSAAIAAGATAGSFGAGAAAAPIAQMAASYGIQLAGNQAKRISSYWFGLAGIGADSLLEIFSPFGVPRALGYDYAGMMPNIGIQDAALGTLEQMGSDAIQKHFAGQSGATIPADPTAATNTNPSGPSASGSMQITSPNAVRQIPMGGTNPMDTNGQFNLDPFRLGDPNGAGGNGGGGSWAKGGAIGVYDNGGVLKPGQLAFNASRTPESILTKQQWNAMAAGASTKPKDSAPLVQNLYAQDMQDAIRQLEKVKRRDMMQYAGRP